MQFVRVTTRIRRNIGSLPRDPQGRGDDRLFAAHLAVDPDGEREPLPRLRRRPQANGGDLCLRLHMPPGTTEDDWGTP